MRRNERVVLCASSAYEEKYYFNEEFELLPEGIQNEIKVIAVLFAEEIGGIFTMEFDDDGNLLIQVSVNDNDFYFDEIGSELKIKEIIRTQKELFASLEVFYKTFYVEG